MSEDGLQRFVAAQDAHGIYDRALGELRSGRKVSHWMWFVFPQLAGLGRSSTAQHYAIGSLDQARAYVAHPVLGARLRECCEALLALPATSADAVLGSVDAVKLRSSMTLFEAAGDTGDTGDVPFGAVLERYFGGERDPLTLRLLGQA